MILSTKSPWLIFLLTAAVTGLAVSGCHRRAATKDDCRDVLDRLIQLELTESGFRDPTLAARWTSELHRQLAPQLDRCLGKRVPTDLRICLSVARTPEEIAHRCLK
ncbi:MAG: hypothetical protein QOI66_1693 [Myxococcales bacterium]|nr:hypothetical protein [Myxococcales bacterium]